MTDASVRTVDRAEVLTGDWPDDVSILISPGVGGRRRHGGVFAGTARSVYDELVARGVTVAYATNRKAPDSVLIFKSAEWWGPVLTIGETVGSGVVAAAIYEGIKEAVRRAGGGYGPNVHAHLDVEEVSEITADGEREVRMTTLSGDSKTVLDGLERILDSHTDGAGTDGH